ncbi:MAG: tetratricopeptide repeat protein [Candidatus Omnitrophica bacterium]|nr:tetratricopeptide repeat protein [Candidatus Omnitrophota bacterium]
MSFLRKLFTLGGDEIYNRAMDNYNSCRYKEAIEGFEKVIRATKGRGRLHKELAIFYKSQAYRNSGIILMHEGKFEEAIKDFMTALEIIPDSTVLHSYLGICYNNIGRFNEAVAELEKGVADKTGDVQARTRLALALRNQGLYDRAIEELRYAVSINPGHADLRYYLGLVLCNKNDYRAAMDELAIALSINPKYTDARTKLDFLRSLASEPDPSKTSPAKEGLFKAITISLSLTPFVSPDASREDEGSYNTLIYIYGEILKEHPNYADIHFKLAQIYENQNKPKDAETEFRKALAINPDFMQARISLGFLYKELSRLEDAAKEFGFVLEKKFPYPMVAFNLGLIYKRLNRNREAAKAFRMALEFDPHFEEAKQELQDIPPG